MLLFIVYALFCEDKDCANCYVMFDCSWSSSTNFLRPFSPLVKGLIMAVLSVRPSVHRNFPRKTTLANTRETTTLSMKLIRWICSGDLKVIYNVQWERETILKIKHRVKQLNRDLTFPTRCAWRYRVNFLWYISVAWKTIYMNK